MSTRFGNAASDQRIGRSRSEYRNSIVVHLFSISAYSMCGIDCRVTWSKDRIDNEPHDAILRRGPDAHHQFVIEGGGGVHILLMGSVLHIRGSCTEIQPLDNSLLWNGEAYEIMDGQTTLSCGHNDGQLVLERIRNQSNGDLREALAVVRGPFSFVYYDTSRDILWFGRDSIGRRSLVACFEEDRMQIASVVLDQHMRWVEVPPGLFSVNVNEPDAWLQFHAWSMDPPIPILYGIDCLAWTHTVASRVLGNSPVCSTKENVECKFLQMLSDSVRKRVNAIDYVAAHDGEARVGLLFSGGIDSTILAALTDKHLPKGEPIDLINVAFGSSNDLITCVPDRQTAINGLLELKKISNTRPWRLIEVDISIEDVKHSYDRVIEMLRPRCTAQDFNIGTILWHGARGKGRVFTGCLNRIESPLCRHVGFECKPNDIRVRPESEFIPYQSQCRILIVGHGADEILGGYARHRTSLQQRGASALKEVLASDFGRFWSRNLGRDDRIISDLAREVRHPFLDEELVHYVQHCDINALCDPSRPIGQGDKMLLRLAARTMGLNRTAALVKRAIQFGSRIANKKTPGHTEITCIEQIHDVVNARNDV